MRRHVYSAPPHAEKLLLSWFLLYQACILQMAATDATPPPPAVPGGLQNTATLVLKKDLSELQSAALHARWPCCQPAADAAVPSLLLWDAH